jgi:hypothetical protein
VTCPGLSVALLYKRLLALAGNSAFLIRIVRQQRNMTVYPVGGPHRLCSAFRSSADSVEPSYAPRLRALSQVASAARHAVPARSR